MSDEHMQHTQCQTCFVHFTTNQELIEHIEKYRSKERLLVAKLEQCRLHLAQSYDTNSGDDDNDDRDKEDDDHEPTARPNQLQCPSPGCKRVDPYTTRGNLFRHFQTHSQCYEMCPFCQEIFRRVDRFARHKCKKRSEKPMIIYMKHRVAQLNKTVSQELDLLESSLSYTRKRAHGVVDSSTRAQKMVKTTQISVLPANTSLQSHLSVAATDDGLTSPSETMKVTATNDTNETFATIGMPANDAGWAFATSMMPANDSGWAFAETVPAMPNDSGWAFAETTMPANDSGWVFTETGG